MYRLRWLFLVATAMIPFLENDDAPTVRLWVLTCSVRLYLFFKNREAPVVGTGMEYKAAYDSGRSRCCKKRGGTVTAVDADTIEIKKPRAARS